METEGLLDYHGRAGIISIVGGCAFARSYLVAICWFLSDSYFQSTAALKKAGILTPMVPQRNPRAHQNKIGTSQQP